MSVIAPINAVRLGHPNKPVPFRLIFERVNDVNWATITIGKDTWIVRRRELRNMIVAQIPKDRHIERFPNG